MPIGNPREVITFRRHAAANPHAMQRQPIGMDDYLSARWICKPFRLYDCCLETDGAVALVVTSLDRARDLRNVPVRMAGFGEAHTHGGSWTQGSGRGVRPAARSSSRRTGERGGAGDDEGSERRGAAAARHPAR